MLFQTFQCIFYITLVNVCDFGEVMSKETNMKAEKMDNFFFAYVNNMAAVTSHRAKDMKSLKNGAVRCDILFFLNSFFFLPSKTCKTCKTCFTHACFYVFLNFPIGTFSASGDSSFRGFSSKSKIARQREW